MLVEIPDLEVILSVILAFVAGIIGLYAYFKIRPFIKTEGDVSDASQTERLEYYERQLIDMKIRLDALEIQGVEHKVKDPNLELREFVEGLAKNQRPAEAVKVQEAVPEKVVSTPSTPKLMPVNPIDYVLQLITDRAMTSRDIQITLKKSREHTSRLMKKLFDDGYVERNTESKPYTYSITEKGMTKLRVDPVPE